MDLKRGILYSAGIHLTLLMLAYTGLPAWFHHESETRPLVISLEPLPISDETNVKPSDKPLRKAKPKPAPKPQDKPTPPASEQPPPEPKQVPPEPKPEPEPQPEPTPPPEPEPEPEPTPPPEPEPEPEPKPEPEPDDKEPAKPKPKPKPKQKTKPEPPEQRSASEEPSLEEVLKDIRDEAKSTDKDTDEDGQGTQEQNLTRSQEAYDASKPLSLSERDAIISQFVRCWRIPAGAANDYELVVSLDVSLRQDGSVIKAGLVSKQRNRYRNDPVFRAAADSALRAVQKCSPIENLPPDRYSSWKEMRLNFDPSMQLY